MDKVVIKCPHCQKKMKITYKPAKYRCPNCKEIYILSTAGAYTLKVKGIFKGAVTTVKDAKENLKRKYRNAKATAEYMAQLRKNMKSNPNWSNYYREQEEMKKAQKPSKFKNFFRK